MCSQSKSTGQSEGPAASSSMAQGCADPVLQAQALPPSQASAGVSTAPGLLADDFGSLSLSLQDEGRESGNRQAGAWLRGDSRSGGASTHTSQRLTSYTPVAPQQSLDWNLLGGAIALDQHFYSRQPVPSQEGNFDATDDDNPTRRQLSAATLQARSSDDVDDGGEGQEVGSENENEEKYQRMRDKNRRAQQRFRQRQKAKLQAKELESYQLQKQIQEMQAQIVAAQQYGTDPGVQLQMARMQAQNQALQLENMELRALATRLLEENAALKAERGSSSVSSAPLRSLGGGLPPLRQQHSPGPMLHSGQQSALGMYPAPPASAAATIPRAPAHRRNQVFSSIKHVPWQRADQMLEQGMPTGANPGGTGARVLLKVLGKHENVSSTVLLQFPPGFIHDYIISTDAQAEEGLILHGTLTDLAFNETFVPGDYANVTPGVHHGPYRADPVEGCLLIAITRAASHATRPTTLG